MNLKDIWNEATNSLGLLLEDADEKSLGLTADHGGYVFVDGEEGDYGAVRYHDSDGQLVATRIIEGGDNEHVCLTEHGRAFLMPKILEMVRDTLEKGLSEMVGDVEVDSEGAATMRPRER